MRDWGAGWLRSALKRQSQRHQATSARAGDGDTNAPYSDSDTRRHSLAHADQPGRLHLSRRLRWHEQDVLRQRHWLQASYIIIGSRNLYVIYTLIAQTETQDTLINVPPLAIVQSISVKVD